MTIGTLTEAGGNRRCERLDTAVKNRVTPADYKIVACNEGPEGDITYDAGCDADTQSSLSYYVRRALSAVRGDATQAFSAKFDSEAPRPIYGQQVIVVVLRPRDELASGVRGSERSPPYGSARLDVGDEALVRLTSVLERPWHCNEDSVSADASGQAFRDLTPRQREVLHMILEGYPNKIIAADLGISMRTVENHRASIMKKTRSKSLSALVRFAIAAGELSGATPFARQ